jgi:outer membrane receptor for monomeric catechols
VYSHPCGFFAQFQALWYGQSSQGYVPPLLGDDFWQLNAFAGYRFPGRKAELRLGLLNLTDQNFRLNPLTLYNDLPRERTVVVRFQFNF